MVSEDLVKAVVLALWRQETGHGGAMSMEQLLAAGGSSATLGQAQEALAILEERSCVLERSPGGLRMLATGLACWKDILEGDAEAERRRLGQRVLVFQKTASTNDAAWEYASDTNADGLVVIADEQSAGRGRMGHQWHARGGQSALVSVLLRDAANASVDRLTLLAGLATARAIEECAQRMGRVSIKWPNDILVGERKLAGILVERRGSGIEARGTAKGHVVIGIGINIGQRAEDFPPELEQRATSIEQWTGSRVDRLRVISLLVNELERYLTWPAEQADEPWLGEWKSRCAMLGTRISVRIGGAGAGSGAKVIGRVLDVAPLQGLLLRDDSGATHFVSSQTATLAP